MSQLDPIKDLQQLIGDGGAKAFDLVPMVLSRVIEERLWESRSDRHGNPFRSFDAFVTTKLWEGLESSIEDLLAFCRKHEDVQALIKREIGAAPEHVGRGHRSDIITPNRGTSPTYALRRLKRDFPELAERVVSGELSANAAAIEAGFRRKPTPLDLLRHAWAKASQDERNTFLAEVT